MSILWNKYSEKWWLFSHEMSIVLIWILLALLRFLLRILTLRKNFLSIKVFSILLSSMHCISSFKRKDRLYLSFNLEDRICNSIKWMLIHSCTHIFLHDIRILYNCCRKRILKLILHWNPLHVCFNTFIHRRCHFYTLFDQILGPCVELSYHWWIHFSSLLCDWFLVSDYYGNCFSC